MKSILLKISEPLKENLEKEAKKRELSLTAYIRLVLVESLKKEK